MQRQHVQLQCAASSSPLPAFSRVSSSLEGAYRAHIQPPGTMPWKDSFKACTDPAKESHRKALVWLLARQLVEAPVEVEHA